MAADDVQPGEEIAEGQARREVERIRTVVADVYTFVRSSEINRTIGAFTFDHYIDEAKRKIKGEGRAIRDAAGEATDVRPTKLAVLESLEKAFTDSFAVIEEMAKKKDLASGEDPQ
jgi:hypothetical protein